jgi:hypothetical protein
MQSQTYQASSRQLLTQAAEELERGDLRQASEKGWGAAAQIIKAIAAARGWEHNGHFLLRRAVDRLVEETGDDQLFTLFGVASHLHMNFYENWSSGAEVEAGLRDVERFLDKLAPLLEQET